MDIDANKVIEKLTQEISQLVLEKTILVAQIEELQEVISKTLEGVEDKAETEDDLK